MTKHDLKEMMNLGAELGASKARNSTRLNRCSLPDREQLCSFFEDVGDTVRWKVRRGYSAAGTMATGKLQGYLTVTLNKRRLLVHRILYKMRTGQEPDYIDHIDGNRANNAQNNLRPATISQNGFNRPVQKNSSSGHKNVMKCSRSGKWLVRVRAENVAHYGGLFDDIEQAASAAQELRKQLHGDFAHD